MKDCVVYEDKQKRSAILLKIDGVEVLFLTLSEPIYVKRLALKSFQDLYNTPLSEYSVLKAAKIYLAASENYGITHEAKVYLEYLTGKRAELNFNEEEESEMARPKKVVEATPAEKPVKAKPVAKATPAAKVEKAVKAKTPSKLSDKLSKTNKVEKPTKVEKTPRVIDTEFFKKKITVLVKENPKRGDAATRFDLYKKGMTVSQYIEAGGKAADVKWDLGREFISLA